MILYEQNLGFINVRTLPSMCAIDTGGDQQYLTGVLRHHFTGVFGNCLTNTSKNFKDIAKSTSK